MEEPWLLELPACGCRCFPSEAVGVPFQALGPIAAPPHLGKPSFLASRCPCPARRPHKSSPSHNLPGRSSAGMPVNESLMLLIGCLPPDKKNGKHASQINLILL